MAAQRDDPEIFDLLVKIYKEAGIDLVVEVLPPLRCTLNVKSGDMLGYLYSNTGIADFFSGMNVVLIEFKDEPIYRFNCYAYVRSSAVDKRSSRERWSSARVGSLLGVPIIRQLGELTGSHNFVEVPSYRNIPKMLNADRFDMIVRPEGYLEPLIVDDTIVPLSNPVAEISYWHVLPEKYAGTPLEHKIRRAFLANRAAFKELFDKAVAR